MREATVIPPGGGEVIGDSPQRRVEILCDDQALNATYSRFAAGRAGADLHVHRRHSDIFYVLDGELVLAAGAPELRAGAGAWVQVPAGAAYELSFPQAARFLELRAPR